MKLYKIKKISENIVEIKLLVFMKIHLVVNMSRIAIYQKQVEEQKKIPVEINKEKKLKQLDKVYRVTWEL